MKTKYQLEEQIEKLEDKIEILKTQLDRKELQLDETISTNSKLTDQLKNLWDEVGCKNDMIRDFKQDLAEIKLDRDRYSSRWKRCIQDKFEQRKKDNETDKAIFEKALSGERTDN
jgi:chromosome segregation ATPase